MKRCLTLTLLLVAPLTAAIQQQNQQFATPSTGSTALNNFQPIQGDLAETSATSSFSSATFFGSPQTLTNGSMANGVYLTASYTQDNLPNSQTFTLNTTQSPDGFQITAIHSYAGHNENGSCLANQKYTLEISRINSDEFTLIGTFSHIPYDPSNTNLAAATRISLSDTSGIIAEHVDAVRITYLDHGYSNGNTAIDGTVYREIDIIGSPMSPPPTPSMELGAIWFIGDSITQSNADGDGSSSPRKALYDILTQQNIGFSFTGHFTANIDGLPATGSSATDNLYQYHSGISGSVIGNNNGGRTGMTYNIDQGQKFWTSGRLAYVKPAIILIMLGTNDTNSNIEPASAPQRISSLIDTIMAQQSVGSPAIFVAKIPPNGISPERAARVINFNDSLPDIVANQRAKGHDVYLVDNFTTIQQNYAAAMRGDNLHTNHFGNQLMAQQWYNAIIQRFDTSSSNTYQSWQFKHFGSTEATQSDPLANPDGDTQPNLVEFALGSSPLSNNAPKSYLTVEPPMLAITARDPETANLKYTLEYSQSLTSNSWTESPSQTTTLHDHDNGFLTIQWNDQLSQPLQKMRFFRVKIENLIPLHDAKEVK
ncbi:SGNH/GDSL hydrolase family protein [Rubritalea tangerina]|uniref:SGNH/GDSL hydrolase family protein n=1 Tax=Rubritalea tangerina TaxID=430798 RepID=A0ABW4ZE69_9BACT